MIYYCNLSKIVLSRENYLYVPQIFLNRANVYQQINLIKKVLKITILVLEKKEYESTCINIKYDAAQNK